MKREGELEAKMKRGRNRQQTRRKKRIEWDKKTMKMKEI